MWRCWYWSWMSEERTGFNKRLVFCEKKGMMRVHEAPRYPDTLRRSRLSRIHKQAKMRSARWTSVVKSVLVCLSAPLCFVVMFVASSSLFCFVIFFSKAQNKDERRCQTSLHNGAFAISFRSFNFCRFSHLRHRGARQPFKSLWLAPTSPAT